MKKRLFSIITALALCLSLLPATALAVADAGDYWTDVLIPWNQTLSDYADTDSRVKLYSTDYVSDNGIYEIWPGEGVFQIRAYSYTATPGNIEYQLYTKITTNTDNTDGVRFRLNIVDSEHITIRCVGNAAPMTDIIGPDKIAKYNVNIDGKYLGWTSPGFIYLSDEPVLLKLENGKLTCVESGASMLIYGTPYFRLREMNLSVNKVQTFTYNGSVQLPQINGISSTRASRYLITDTTYSMEHLTGDNGEQVYYGRNPATTKPELGFPKDVGQYKAYIYVKRICDSYTFPTGPSGTNDFVFGPITVNIVNQAQITKDAAPVTGLVYNGQQQALVRAAEGTGGTVKYRVNDGEWSESIPTAKDAGTYTVYYKVFGEAFNDGTSDVSISDSETKSVSVTIAKQALTVNSNEVKLSNSAYTGKSQTARCLKNGEYGSTSKYIPADAITYGGSYQATAVGTYTATVQPSSNYTWKDGSTNSVSLEWKITSTPINLTGITAESRPYEAGNLEVNVTWAGTVQPLTNDDDAQETLDNALKNGALVITVDSTGVMEDDAVGVNKKVRVTATMTGTNEEYLNGFKLNYIGGSNNQLYVFNCVDITKPEYTLIAPTAAENLTYDGTEKTLLTTGASSEEETSGATVTYSYRLGTDGTWSADIPTATDAGTYQVYYRANETANYAETVCETPVRVTIKPCEIALPTDADLVAATYDGSEQTASLNESYTHRDKVAFTAGQVQTNAGTHSVTLSLTDSNYIWPNAQTTCTLNWTISPKTIGIQWGNTALTYNGSQQAPTATATGLVGEDTCTITVTGGETDAGENYTATATGVGNSNYQLPTEDSAKQTGFSISPAEITGVTLTSDSAVYTGSSQSPAISAVKAGTLTLATGDYTVSYENSSGEAVTDLTNVGSYKVVVTAKGNSNFTGSANADFQITKAETNSWTTEPSVTGWTYGDENPTLPTATPKFGTVTVEYKDKGADDSTYSETAPTNAGSYTVRFSVAETDNYAGLTETKDLTITPKTIGIQWGNTTFTYNGTSQKPTATATGLVGIDTCNITVTGEQTNAGNNYTATATAVDNTNYQLPVDNTTAFVINPKEVAVTAGTYEVTKTYDGTTDAGTASGALSVSGILAADSGVSVVPTPGAYTSPNVGGQNTVAVSLALNGTGSANYRLAADTVNVPCSITPRPITISTASATNRDYIEGDVSVETDVTFDNAVTSMTKNTDYTVTGTMDNANAGTGKTVNVTVTLTNGNYSLADNTTTTVTISKIAYPGTTTATGSAMYGNPGTVDLSSYLADGGSFGTVTVTINNSVLSSDPVMEGNTLKFAFADNRDNVGKTAEITVPVTGATNYNDYTITVTVTVEAKLIPVVTAPTAVDGLVYDGETHALITAGTTTGGTTLLYSLNGTDYSTGLPTATNAGTYTVYYKVEGNLTYVDVDAKSLTVTIAKKEVTATPKDVTITTGSAIPAFELIYTGLLGEDTLTPNSAPTFTCYEKDGTTAVSTRTAAGSYTITWTNTDIFDGETNYRVVAATGTLTINNPRPIIPTTPSQPTDTTTKNPDTGDMGIALYAGMALLSLTGGAWVVNKKRKGK